VQYVSVRRQVLDCDATALTGMRIACMRTFCKGCALHACSAARWLHTGTEHELRAESRQRAQ
jgi:hypothetical protein